MPNSVFIDIPPELFDTVLLLIFANDPPSIDMPSPFFVMILPVTVA